MVQKISVVSVRTGKPKGNTSKGITFFAENFHRDELFHLNSPRNFRVFHTNGRYSRFFRYVADSHRPSLFYSVLPFTTANRLACVAGGIVYQSSEIWRRSPHERRSREKYRLVPTPFFGSWLRRQNFNYTIPPAAQATNRSAHCLGKW